MTVIIDTNIIIAALVKDSISRHLIAALDVGFYYPEQAFEEIIRNKNEIMKKGKLSEEEFNVTLIRLFKYIRLVKKEEIGPYIKEADAIIGAIHKNDVIFIAAALAKGAAVWSNDEHFQKQDKIPVITTKEVITNYRKLMEKI